MFRFTIRDVLWLMVVVGVELGWVPNNAYSGRGPDSERIDLPKNLPSENTSTPETEPKVVSRRIANGEKLFMEYAAQFVISPERAEAMARDYFNSLPADDRAPFDGLIGMVGDEYLFARPLKEGFLLAGYRIDARNGAARYVSRQEVVAEYGQRFRNGYIPSGELKTYLRYK